ncbi:MAG: hypothetical protein EXS48_03175 [Candidatus Staskawiczbacteria bacterium]|nr:hypothetical protein [Candidatus Staskawiczbacteria bacterium]
MKKYLAVIILVVALIVLGAIAVGVMGFNNSKTVFAKALKENNPALCETIRVIPGMHIEDIPEIFMYVLFAIPDKTHGARVGCYMNIAKQTNSVKACDLINSTYAGDCYIQLVMEEVRSKYYTESNGNGSCQDRTGFPPIDQEACFTAYYDRIAPEVIGQFKSVCEQAVDSSRKDLCYQGAMFQMKQDENRFAKSFIALCDNIQGKDSKEFCLSLGTQ